MFQWMIDWFRKNFYLYFYFSQFCWMNFIISTFIIFNGVNFSYYCLYWRRRIYLLCQYDLPYFERYSFERKRIGTSLNLKVLKIRNNRWQPVEWNYDFLNYIGHGEGWIYVFKTSYRSTINEKWGTIFPIQNHWLIFTCNLS